MRPFSPERAIDRHLTRWVRLLGLGRWHITWELTDQPIDHEIPIARNDYTVKRSGRRMSHIRFDKFHIRSDAQAERAVVHELLHIFDHGLGNDLHAFIYRLERPLRLARIRATRRTK